MVAHSTGTRGRAKGQVSTAFGSRIQAAGDRLAVPLRGSVTRIVFAFSRTVAPANERRTPFASMVTRPPSCRTVGVSPMPTITSARIPSASGWGPAAMVSVARPANDPRVNAAFVTSMVPPGAVSETELGCATCPSPSTSRLMGSKRVSSSGSAPALVSIRSERRRGPAGRRGPAAAGPSVRRCRPTRAARDRSTPPRVNSARRTFCRATAAASRSAVLRAGSRPILTFQSGSNRSSRRQSAVPVS